MMSFIEWWLILFIESWLMMSFTEILQSEHECVIMGDFNLPTIDRTLQRPTPVPAAKN